LRAVGAGELINITVFLRQQRGNPETMLDNHKKTLLFKTAPGLLHLRRDIIVPQIKTLAPTVRNDDSLLIPTQQRRSWPKDKDTTSS